MIQNTKGWIQLSRSITELPYYFGEKFNLSQCFIDMLILAEWKDERTFYSHGHKICLKRGQIAMPIRQLAARWSMTPNTVLSRLERMETDGLINTTDTDSDTNTDTNPATQTFSDSMIQTPIATPTDTPIETPTDILSLRVRFINFLTSRVASMSRFSCLAVRSIASYVTGGQMRKAAKIASLR